MTRLSPHGADLVLEDGRASFAVVHRVLGRWQVNTGPFAVQVTGTRFDVEWHSETDHFELRLYEGHVRVSGCALGDGQELSAGQRLEASCARPEVRISALGGPLRRVEPPPERSPKVAQDNVGAALGEGHSDLAPQAQIPAHEAAPARDKPSPPINSQGSRRLAPRSALDHGSASNSWLDLARAGRFGEAYEMASSLGFEHECSTREAADLLLLGDAARLSGRVERAREAYQTVRRRWPNSQSGSLAAFQMGRLEFDQRSNFSAAEGWLKVYVKEQANGEFAAAAIGRLMEAELRLGRNAAARDLAKSYLDRYPKGAYAKVAIDLLAAVPTHAD